MIEWYFAIEIPRQGYMFLISLSELSTLIKISESLSTGFCRVLFASLEACTENCMNSSSSLV